MKNTKYTSINNAAYNLGLPQAYLKELAEAGRIPHIRTRKSILVNLEAVEAALAEMAASGVMYNEKTE